jgi:hypothetical protein
MPDELTPRHPGGRPPKERKKTANPPPEVRIDFSRDPADQILPCRDHLQSKHLGEKWSVSDVRAINDTLGLYKLLPMVCKASGCFWATQCPTAQYGFLFEGLKCPLEIGELYRTFVRYVRELNVGPDEHVDLTTIADLCRLDLQIKRIDQQIQVDGMMYEHVAGVIQGNAHREGKAVKEKVAHPLLHEQGKMRKQRSEAYKELAIQRGQRLEQEEKKQQGVKNALELFAAMRKLEIARPDALPEPLPMLPSMIIEGEVVSSPDDDRDEDDDE